MYSPFVLDLTLYGFTGGGSSGLLSTFGWIHSWAAQSDIRISDHVERSQALLIEQFQYKQRINDMVRCLVQRAQDIEDVGNDLLNLRWIDTAAVAQLDAIGDIVGEPRQGRDDPDYRLAIKFRIFINASNGEPETLIALAKGITDTPYVNLIEIQPATVQLELTADDLPSDFTEQAQKACAAGVQLHVTNFTGLIPFMFDLTGGDPPEMGDGFAELSEMTDGGEFTELIP